MGSPPPVQLEVEVCDENLDEDVDMLPSYRTPLPDLADAMVEMARSKLAEQGVLSGTHFQDYWRVTVPQMYSPQPNRTCLDWSFDEDLAHKLLIKPLEQFIWGTQDGEQPAAPRRSTLCGRVFKAGEPAYSCRECGMDNTCVLCVECFKASSHRHHKYKMGQSGGGGCCDCGDSEAWKRDPFCDLHAAPLEQGDSEPSASGVNPDVIKRMKIVSSIVFSYCFRLLTVDHAPGLPNDLRLKDSERDPLQILDQPDCYCTVLYNDETHTFEQVITTLSRVIKCNHRDAVELVTLIDREGRALVRCNSFQVCDKLKTDIETCNAMFERYTSQHGPPLKVLVMHAHLIAHQYFSMKLLNWLQNFVSQEASLRLAVGEVALGEDCCSGDSTISIGGVAAGVMQNDCYMWKAARTAWHRLLIATTVMDYNTKKSLAILFTKNYAFILKDFIRDDHDHSFSVSSLSVQLYTTPTLAHYLIAKHDAILVIMNTFLSECHRRTNKDGRLEFNRNHVSKAFKRAQHVLYDLKYLLGSVPTTFTDDLRKGFLHGLSQTLNLFTMMQGMDAVVRQIGQHMEYEPEWESAFNLHVKLAQSITLLLEWCAADRVLTAKAYRMTLQKIRDSSSIFPDSVIKELGSKSATVIPYDVSVEAVSIHRPVSRFLAGLHLALEKHGYNYHSREFDFSELAKPSPEIIIEPILCTSAMIAQVHAGMWRRNGFALLNQLYFYHSVKCRYEMMDRDIVMLQIGASLIESNEFMIHVLCKFKLLDWAGADFESQSVEDDSMRQIISMVEEFLGLLITVIGSRYVPGVGEVTNEDRTKKEVIQMLCIKPMAHSELNKNLPEDQLHETGLEAVIDDVADFRKPSAGNRRGMYRLKPHLYDEYDIFFYHYTREDLSRSEEVQRSRRKAAGLPECCPPPPLPKLTQSFKLIANLLQCETAIHVLKTVFERALNLRARSFSETQVHKALHLMGYALRDEESGHYEFVAFAETAQRAGLEALLQKMATSPRIEAHRPLIQWTLQKMRSLLGQNEEKVEQSESMEIDQPEKSTASDESEKARRAKLAAERRAAILAKMQADQKNFISNNATLFNETITESPEVEEMNPPQQSSVSLGVWGSGASEPPRTCIMCQEDARVERNAAPMVLVAFVQHSTVLNRHREGASGCLPKDWTEPWLPGGVGHGPHVSSCGHVLHATCWRKYVDSVADKESRRPYRMRQPPAFHVSKKEYLCPLCERLCNTAIPLLPALPNFLISPPFVSEQLYADSVDIILNHQVCFKAVHYCTETCDEMHCVASVSTEALPDVDPIESNMFDRLPPYIESHCNEFLTTEFRNIFSFPVPFYKDSTVKLIKEFCAFLPFICCEPDKGGTAYVAALCRATSYTILAVEAVLQAEKRPLLGDMPARHHDVLQALVRIAAALPSIWQNPKQITHHALGSLNALERTSPMSHTPFSTMLAAVISYPCLFSRNGCNAEPGHYARQLTLQALRCTLTRAMIALDLGDCREGEPMEEEYEKPNPELDGLLSQIKDLRRGNLYLDNLKADRVWEALKGQCHRFLRCCCLFYHFLSDATPTTGLTTAGLDSWDVMCDYLDMPKTYAELLNTPIARAKVSYWGELATDWFSGDIQPHIVIEPPAPPVLVSLPEDYSELMNIVSEFSCPNSEREDCKYPTMCLVCGQILCSQSYCCQSEIKWMVSVEVVGAVVAHALTCGGGAGLFLRVRDCELLMLAVTDRGAMCSAPYLDSYGETDQGLRRGNPLQLCSEKYDDLRMVWLSHGLHERIARALDVNVLLTTQWQNM